MEKSESKIQQEIFQWFHNNYCLPHHNLQCCIYHIPNQNQQRLVSIGVKAGVPDLQVILPGPKFIYVEVKDHKGQQSEKQKEFEAYCNKVGIPYYLVRSLDEFKVIVSAYLD